MAGPAVTSEAVGANGRMVDGGKLSANLIGNRDVTMNGAEKRRDRFNFSASPSLEEIRQRQPDLMDERDGNQFNKPINLLLAMGDVAEHFQWRGVVAEGLPDWTEKERNELTHELSDVLIYLVQLAEKCHVDLPQAVLAKMELNARKRPACKAPGSAKMHTEHKD